MECSSLQVLRLPVGSLREGGLPSATPLPRHPWEDVSIDGDYSSSRQPAFPPCGFIKCQPGNKVDSPRPGKRADTYSSRDLDSMADKVSRMQPKGPASN